MFILFTNAYKSMFGDSPCNEGDCPGTPGIFSNISSSMSLLTSLLILINFLDMLLEMIF